MSKDNGGPAFPIIGRTAEYHYGMSPLYYFAANAFQIRLAQAEDRGWTLTEVCEQSWIDATAMLKARK